MTIGALRWKPWAMFGAAALAWWFYAAPAIVAKQIRASVAEPPTADSPVASRVDFARINARLPAFLHEAAGDRLDAKGFSHLLLYGWLPRQRPRVDPAKPPQPGLSARAGQSQLYHVRYRALNRAVAIFWDAYQVHEVVLTLERANMLAPWRVTKVAQISTCAYDLDCPTMPLAELMLKNKTSAPR